MTDTGHDEKTAGAEAAEIPITKNVRRLDARIRELEARYGREPRSVGLLAVSKKKPVVAIQAAFEAGQRAFGENYLDEAEAKMDALLQTDIEWHFIGAVQSRKTEECDAAAVKLLNYLEARQEATVAENQTVRPLQRAAS